MVIEDTVGVTTADETETNLLNISPAVNGFIELGGFVGGTALVELHSTGDASTVKLYTAITQETTYQIQQGANIAVPSGGSAITTINETGEFLRATVTRGALVNVTLRYAIIITKAGGTM